MANYYMPTDDLKHITSDSWKRLHHSDGIEYSIRSGEIDRDEAYADLEQLDVRQMYKVADAAPAWDCFETDYYERMAELAGVNYYAYDDLEAMMDAIKEAIEK